MTYVQLVKGAFGPQIMGVKPRIRPHPRLAGRWLCGTLDSFDWCEGGSPEDAYDRWDWYWRRS